MRDRQKIDLKDRDDEIVQLDVQEKEMKAKYEKMIIDLQDRIKVIKMGQEKHTSELKSTKTELKQENKKFDRYLERD